MAKTGGNAFPIFTLRERIDGDGLVPDWDCSSHGMSLRDYFAGQALAALLGSSERMSNINEVSATSGAPYASILAMTAYGVADAMLLECAK